MTSVDIIRNMAEIDWVDRVSSLSTREGRRIMREELLPGWLCADRADELLRANKLGRNTPGMRGALRELMVASGSGVGRSVVVESVERLVKEFDL